MVSRMDLKTEKIPNLDTSAPAIKSLGLPAYNWWEEASSGVSVDAPRGTTKFAYPITTGMSFNRTLWQLTGRQIGHEARALMNIGQVWWHSRRQQACCVYVVAVCVCFRPHVAVRVLNAFLMNTCMDSAHV